MRPRRGADGLSTSPETPPDTRRGVRVVAPGKRGARKIRRSRRWRRYRTQCPETKPRPGSSTPFAAGAWSIPGGGLFRPFRRRSPFRGRAMLALTDAQLQIVMAAAAAVLPDRRSLFFISVNSIRSKFGAHLRGPLVAVGIAFL